MLQCKKNCGLLYAVILENHLKYTFLKTNSVNVNENMVLGLFYAALTIAVFM
jgi:hypothetical protein